MVAAKGPPKRVKLAQSWAELTPGEVSEKIKASEARRKAMKLKMGAD